MENNKNKKSVKFQGGMLIFCDFIQVFVFTRNHHLKQAAAKSSMFYSGTVFLSTKKRVIVVIKPDFQLN